MSPRVVGVLQTIVPDAFTKQMLQTNNRSIVGFPMHEDQQHPLNEANRMQATAQAATVPMKWI